MNELESIELPDALDNEDGNTGSALADFLYPAPAKRNAKSIIWWWESRRLHYNAIVGGTGLVTMGVFEIITSLPPGAHDIPFIWGPAILGYGLLANACYLLGPTAEIAIEKITRGKILPTGPGLFRMGLTFSVGLTLLPTLIAGIDWIVRIFGSIF
jgi:hypothetical protein